ncbi:hypothetical protein Patl1_10465 [Pistacia atlantica]|uniref:Uncharacterized protein n=1 Tax=Pistacia atlantica TaxID=434234 RepID=A0ACC1A6N0_9ROSI|nr:hypothetical protein Patl1_10465 [Pistacia atlantica]
MALPGKKAWSKVQYQCDALLFGKVHLQRYTFEYFLTTVQDHQRKYGLGREIHHRYVDVR